MQLKGKQNVIEKEVEKRVYIAGDDDLKLTVLFLSLFNSPIYHLSPTIS